MNNVTDSISKRDIDIEYLKAENQNKTIDMATLKVKNSDKSWAQDLYDKMYALDNKIEHRLVSLDKTDKEQEDRKK